MHVLNIKLLSAFRLKGWRAYELAKKAGIEKTRFCRIVNKKLEPTVKEKQNLSKILRTSQKELF
jgi:ribosome-binding protein aMBF1 (putative translation factor)